MTHLPMVLLLASFAPAPPAVQAPPVAQAQDAGTCRAETATEAPAPSPWSGGGELGLASNRGNSTSESLNTRLDLQYKHGDWIHGIDLFGLRTRAEYEVDDGNGGVVRERKTTANRYTFGANSALTLGEHRQFTAALRVEQDDFGTYAWQQTASVGYGTRVMDGERTQLDLQVGPGYRRAHDAEDGVTRSGFIGRGFIGLKFDLTDNTELANTLLIESGAHNTYAQNELGVSVTMNSHLALKAGVQARHNSDVDADQKKTDTLTTMNVVYRFK